MTTNDARGTPAIPLEVTISIRSIVICVSIGKAMPYACAMNRIVKVQ